MTKYSRSQFWGGVFGSFAALAGVGSGLIAGNWGEAFWASIAFVLAANTACREWELA